MKATSLLAILLPTLLAAPLLTAAPELQLDTPEIRPGSSIQITFDKPVVNADVLGKQVEQNIVTTKPKVDGKISWLAPSIARFIPTGAPPIGKEITFTLRKGLKHIDGTPVPAVELRKVKTAPFAYEYADRNGTRRMPEFYLRFNDAISPDAAAPYFSFRDKAGQSVAAKARRALWSDIHYTSRIGPTWGQAFHAWERPEETDLKASDAFPTGLIVTPASPLPVGEDWRLVMLPGIPNTSRTAVTTAEQSRWAGTISPFAISVIKARTVVDQPRSITIELNKSIDEETTSAQLAKFISIDPVPTGLKMTAKGTQLIILDGDFSQQDTWKITVKDGFRADDGLAIREGLEKTVTFKNLHPQVLLPSRDEAQLASGSRDYPIRTINVESIRVRIKKLSGDDAIRAFQGYRHYSGDGPGSTRIKKTHSIPFELVNGTVIADVTIPLDGPVDTSRTTTLDWSKYLPADEPHALLFLSVDSTPEPGLTGEKRPTVSQAFVQLTDLGLAWKLSNDEAFLYAYSCQTGKPLPGVRFEVFGEDAQLLETARTDANGTARLPRKDVHRHLRATWRDDTFLTAFDERMDTVSMWRFPVRYSWEYEPAVQRKVYLFTDRNLYRPGETVHLKGIVRQLEDNVLTAEPTQGARLVVRDSRNRIIREADITFSKKSSFDESFDLPAETVGRFYAEVTWPDELAKAAETEDWRERYAMQSNAEFQHMFRVQEFRRNAFEVESTLAIAEDGKSADLGLDANYYQGQPVAQGKVTWYFNTYKQGFYPSGFRDYLFTDHRSYDHYYWSHYFGYGDSYYRSRSHSESGAAILDAKGQASLSLTLPDEDFPTPRRVEVTSEVTDQRNQTLSSTATTTMHSSDVYLGVSRVDRLVRVGDNYPLQVVAVTKEGKPSPEPVQATLRIDREYSTQVKVKTTSGRISVRNEKHIEPVGEQTITIQPGDMKDGGLTVPFAPLKNGKHLLEFTGTDPNGKRFRTATTIHVYGSKDYPWAYESGMKIKLVAEKKLYRPGETARVLVLSPIEGTALVTLEREGVQRSFVTELRADDPVIEIPVTDTEAPNAFFSVLVIKGARENMREIKEPILRLGYCELTVENVRERLSIAMDIPGDYHRPGESVTVEGLVTTHDGRPAADAEVTLYAEDEGTLAVAGYQNPSPMSFFYEPRSLRTNAGTSLDNFISEDSDRRYFSNKGFVVGGGGEDFEDLEVELREDFSPCAHWAPALVTGPDGRFRASFNSPDTLTRYRVIAVAHQNTDRFGSKAAGFVVNKPLMLEPSVPRFAHEGDVLHPKVLVQNATGHAGTWAITLKLDSITNFMEGTDRSQTRTVTLGPKENHALSFDVVFHDTGTTGWTWTATPVALDTGEELTASLRRDLSDAVVSRFNVEYPMPLLRETHFVRFDGADQSRNLLDDLSPELLQGRGEVELHFGKSLLLEAGGAIDYLLQYPYGCLEQTTSSTIPWIAAANLRELAPAFQGYTPEHIRRTIQAGANRILSMQTRDGGLAYWTGTREAEIWATSYGGMGLLLCKKAGADVPDEAIGRLTGFLEKSLQNVDSKADYWRRDSLARACYVLAMAGKPATAYQNKLLDGAEGLPNSSRLFLALAFNETGTPEAKATAKRLLAMKDIFTDRRGHWMSYHPSSAFRLLATSEIDPDAAMPIVDQLLQDRNPQGHWNTTWGNAWSFYALGNYAAKVENHDRTATFNLVTANGVQTIKLDKGTHSGSVKIPLQKGMKAILSTADEAFVRVQLASKPEMASRQPISDGKMAILRSYHRVHPDGSTEPLDQPRVGDLVKVQLDVRIPQAGTRYLAIDDPLPALFETVNADFASQAGNVKQARTSWRVSHRELRDDRALFFINYADRSGQQTLEYYARVTSAGNAVAPPAKVEAMYDPQSFALSASQAFQTPNPLATAGQ